jgi:hypothetical protein
MSSCEVEEAEIHNSSPDCGNHWDSKKPIIAESLNIVLQADILVSYKK